MDSDAGNALGMRRNLEILVADQYPRVATDLLAPVLELLRLSRDHFGGDIDKFLVMLVVGLRTTRRPTAAGAAPRPRAGDEPRILPGLGTNARSIADSLQMPKETVRRKVCDLIEAGWLARRNSKLYVTSTAYQQFTPLREQIERLAIDHYEVVAALQTHAAACG